MNVVSYSLLLSVLEYQTAVMRQDFDTAKQVRTVVSKQKRRHCWDVTKKFKLSTISSSCTYKLKLLNT